VFHLWLKNAFLKISVRTQAVIRGVKDDLCGVLFSHRWNTDETQIKKNIGKNCRTPTAGQASSGTLIR
jgi:hypothetical protein